MVKFLLRLIKHLSILVLVSIPLQLLGIIILLPVVVYCHYTCNTKLPKCIAWFDSFDLYSDRDKSVYLQVIESGILKRYIWLAFRNPLNYFGYKVLGIQVGDIPLKQLYYHGDRNVGDGSYPGFYSQEVEINGHSYYEYYLIVLWSPTKCLRFRMGYKIGTLTTNPPGSYIQQVCVLQPYKDYWGK